MHTGCIETELRFYIPPQHKIRSLQKRSSQPTSWHSTEHECIQSIVHPNREDGEFPPIRTVGVQINTTFFQQPNCFVDQFQSCDRINCITETHTTVTCCSWYVQLSMTWTLPDWHSLSGWFHAGPVVQLQTFGFLQQAGKALNTGC